MSLTGKEILQRRKARAAANVSDGFRRALNRGALYKTKGGFEPSGVPEGAGPPYNPEKTRRRRLSSNKAKPG